MGQVGDGLGVAGSSFTGSPGAVAELVGQPPPGLGDGATGLTSFFITGSPGAWVSPEGQVLPGGQQGTGVGSRGA